MTVFLRMTDNGRAALRSSAARIEDTKAQLFCKAVCCELSVHRRLAANGDSRPAVAKQVA